MHSEVIEVALSIRVIRGEVVVVAGKRIILGCRLEEYEECVWKGRVLARSLW